MLKHLRIRDVRKGMVLCVDETHATVSSTEWMDGSNGERPVLIGGNRKTAVGIRINFDNHAPIIAHPGDEVPL